MQARRDSKRSATVPAPGQTPADVIERRREVWDERPLTREVYRRYFDSITRELAPGPCTVEVAGGSGMARQFLPGALVTDLVRTPHVDLVADALRLPFGGGTLDNLFLLDGLHHLPRPAPFFDEAIRVLRPGGRLVMLEPFISPLSHLAFRLAHPEPVDMHADPIPDGDRTVFEPGGPFASNQAIPTLIFFRHRARFAARFPALELRTCRRLSVLAYPLSGGFSGPCLVPRWAHRPLWALEYLATPLRPFAAFRLLVTLERRASP